MTEILILDYNRPAELNGLVYSLNKHCKFDHKIVVLNNGGQRYADNLLNQGKIHKVIHKVIHNDINIGCGAGTVQLFSQCLSEFAFYIQVDHRLAMDLTEDFVNYMSAAIRNKSVFYFDLAGNQGHGKYSERAQFIGVKDYLMIPKSFGGPGPLQNLLWSEESVQNYIIENKLNFISVYGDIDGESISPFVDCGWSSVRSNPDGSIWEHKPDTKLLKCIKKPTEKFTYPKLTNSEWEVALAGEWPKDGAIPEMEIDSSFEVWNKKPVNKK